MNRPAILRTIEMTRELEARDATLNMETWGNEYTCGTAGCVAGWMTIDPALRAMGLRNIGDDPGLNGSSHMPWFGNSNCYDALAAFLDAPYDDVTEAFGSHNPNSWPKARERLQGLLDGV